MPPNGATRHGQQGRRLNVSTISRTCPLLALENDGTLMSGSGVKFEGGGHGAPTQAGEASGPWSHACGVEMRLRACEWTSVNLHVRSLVSCQPFSVFFRYFPSLSAILRVFPSVFVIPRLSSPISVSVNFRLCPSLAAQVRRWPWLSVDSCVHRRTVRPAPGASCLCAEAQQLVAGSGCGDPGLRQEFASCPGGHVCHPAAPAAVSQGPLSRPRSCQEG
ncbi:uncharacterized protein LOC130682255 [Manis pentadactyla]|uniref:uncharacterized protein LOC130682255 n=1 Tax=Manis pentadactyla TaxID=143292 RepID=UPI00255C9EB3|nr:uncharacterized protein LOC130682255 [Manis pentadactyla]